MKIRLKQTKYRKRKPVVSCLFFFVLTAAATFFLLLHLEEAVMPTLREISHIQCKAIAKSIMDQAITDVMQELEPSSGALLQQTEESYIANTVYINQFCTRLSRKITEGFAALPEDPIQIPLGAVLPFSFLANAGPDIPFSLLPMGTAQVEYDTAFYAAGINQINYKIWLNISMELKIVNPLQYENITSTRRIMLADLIFGGKVPTHYFQLGEGSKIGEADEYLLTE